MPGNSAARESSNPLINMFKMLFKASMFAAPLGMVRGLGGYSETDEVDGSINYCEPRNFDRYINPYSTCDSRQLYTTDDIEAETRYFTDESTGDVIAQHIINHPAVTDAGTCSDRFKQQGIANVLSGQYSHPSSYFTGIERIPDPTLEYSALNGTLKENCENVVQSFVQQHGAKVAKKIKKRDQGKPCGEDQVEMQFYVSSKGFIEGTLFDFRLSDENYETLQKGKAITRNPFDENLLRIDFAKANILCPGLFSPPEQVWEAVARNGGDNGNTYYRNFQHAPAMPVLSAASQIAIAEKISEGENVTESIDHANARKDLPSELMFMQYKVVKASGPPVFSQYMLSQAEKSSKCDSGVCFDRPKAFTALAEEKADAARQAARAEKKKQQAQNKRRRNRIREELKDEVRAEVLAEFEHSHEHTHTPCPRPSQP